jgi:hypothetical protein
VMVRARPLICQSSLAAQTESIRPDFTLPELRVLWEGAGWRTAKSRDLEGRCRGRDFVRNLLTCQEVCCWEKRYSTSPIDSAIQRPSARGYEETLEVFLPSDLSAEDSNYILVMQV